MWVCVCSERVGLKVLLNVKVNIILKILGLSAYDEQCSTHLKAGIVLYFYLLPANLMKRPKPCFDCVSKAWFIPL